MALLNIRRTGQRSELDALWTSLIQAFKAQFAGNRVMSYPEIADGTTAGTFQLTSQLTFMSSGVPAQKAATDDLWDLSGETDTDGSTYRAYALALDSEGTASIVAGEDAASEEAAPLTFGDDIFNGTAIVAVFIAGPSTDFDDAGGLSAQGTLKLGFHDSYVPAIAQTIPV